MLDLLIQDSSVIDMPPLTHTKQQAGFLWVLALQLLGGEELQAVTHNLFHPPNIMFKTEVYREREYPLVYQMMYLRVTQQAFSSASLTSLLKQKANFHLRAACAQIFWFQPSYTTQLGRDKELSTGDVSTAPERTLGRQQ